MITTKITASKIGGFGFYVEGEAPCRINVLPNSAASFAGLTTGDILIAINGVKLRDANHSKVARHYQKIADKREVVITFMENYLEMKPQSSETVDLVSWFSQDGDLNVQESGKQHDRRRRQKCDDENAAVATLYDNYGCASVGEQEKKEEERRRGCSHVASVDACDVCRTRTITGATTSLFQQIVPSASTVSSNYYHQKYQQQPQRHQFHYHCQEQQQQQADGGQSTRLVTSVYSTPLSTLTVNNVFSQKPFAGGGSGEEGPGLSSANYGAVVTKLSSLPPSQQLLAPAVLADCTCCHNCSNVEDKSCRSTANRTSTIGCASTTICMTNLRGDEEKKPTVVKTFKRDSTKLEENQCRQTSSSSQTTHSSPFSVDGCVVVEPKKRNSVDAHQPPPQKQQQHWSGGGGFLCEVKEETDQHLVYIGDSQQQHHDNFEQSSGDGKENVTRCATLERRKQKSGYNYRFRAVDSPAIVKGLVRRATEKASIRAGGINNRRSQLFHDKQGFLGCGGGTEEQVFYQSVDYPQSSASRKNTKQRIETTFTTTNVTVARQHPSQQQHMPSAGASSSSASLLQLDKTDIEQVLRSETARAPFQQFLQQQFCAENINFYLAVEEYRLIPDEEANRRTEFGRQIFERHFAANCIEPVNIDNSTANSIREAYRQNKFTSDLFDVVQYQIFHLLKYDCWPRYLRAGGQTAEELGGDGSMRGGYGDPGASTSTGKNAGVYSSANEVCGADEKRGGSSRRKSFFRCIFQRIGAKEENGGCVTTAAISDGSLYGREADTDDKCSVASSSVSCPPDAKKTHTLGRCAKATKHSDKMPPQQTGILTSKSSTVLNRRESTTLKKKKKKAVEDHHCDDFGALNVTVKNGNSAKSDGDNELGSTGSLSKRSRWNQRGDIIESDGGRVSTTLLRTSAPSSHLLGNNDVEYTPVVAIAKSRSGESGSTSSLQPSGLPPLPPKRIGGGGVNKVATPLLKDKKYWLRSIKNLNVALDSTINAQFAGICRNKHYTTDICNNADGASSSRAEFNLDNMIQSEMMFPAEPRNCLNDKDTAWKAKSATLDHHFGYHAVNGGRQAIEERPATAALRALDDDVMVASLNNTENLMATRSNQMRLSMAALRKKRRSFVGNGVDVRRRFSNNRVDDELTAEATDDDLDDYDVVCGGVEQKENFDVMNNCCCGGGSGDDDSGDLEAGHNTGQHFTKSLREPPADLPIRTCTLLCADSASSSEIMLTDQLQSVKQWASAMAESCGLDKNATEVVDAQTGTTIDPARQAVDALNNRTVRIMPVVKFPVVFLAPSQASGGGTIMVTAKPSMSIPAKVVLLRARVGLTVGKVLRPIMAKYNVDADQAVVCIAGTCEVVQMQLPVNSIYHKSLTVMSQQQFSERRSVPKREYQKELNLVPAWMLMSSSATGGAGSGSTGGAAGGPTFSAATNVPGTNPSTSGANDLTAPIPFIQHGDVGFCELTIEPDGGKGLKLNATRSYSSNPREFFKFGRKPSQAKSARGLGSGGIGAFVGGTNDATTSSNAGTSTVTTSMDANSSAMTSSSPAGGDLMFRSGASNKGSAAFGGDRRKSLGATAIGSAGGGALSSTITVAAASTASNSCKMGSRQPQQPPVEKSDIPYCGEASTDPDVPSDPVVVVVGAATKTDGGRSSMLKSGGRGENGQMPGVPAIYASSVRSDRDTAATPTEVIESGLAWQKADYV